VAADSDVDAVSTQTRSFSSTSLNRDFGGWLESAKVARQLSKVLHGCDDGELYLQRSVSEGLTFADGRLKGASYNCSHGFGLRAVCGEQVAFAHASSFDPAALNRAVDAVAVAKQGYKGHWDVSPTGNSHYSNDPRASVPEHAFDQELKLLQRMDDYARSRDPRVAQCSASLSGAQSRIEILRPGDERFSDFRSTVSLSVNVLMRDGARLEGGKRGLGGRFSRELLMAESTWQPLIDEALRQADVNLRSTAVRAGKSTVVLGPGWPGVMLHEAVGHGLEGDAIRKGRSVYAGMLGEQVAAKGVTVVDNGTVPDKRGSLAIDDEGTGTQETVLIEDGVLCGFMQDRLNSRLMSDRPTGNGRRQSYAHAPMPRMTNTYMKNGLCEPEEIIASVEDGIYAVDFGGGQVDTTSGNFVFSFREAYKIRHGRIEQPVKGATMIGNGPEAMRKVSFVGNDMALDEGIAVCGKAGQDVLVGVGQPTLRLDDMTIGGTE
tara:strand:- start:2677 stop:4146 length:1470 start_codon:yes stop_codon:yes gene_type:complete